MDLLLLDVGLPDGSGLDLLAELRADDRHPALPVIILTGAGYDDVLVRAVDLGASCVTKPFSPTKLRHMVEDLIGTAESS